MRGDERAAGPQEKRDHPPRVAFVLGGLGCGGTELQVQLLVRELSSRGLDVHVFLIEGNEESARAAFAGVQVTVLTGRRKRSLLGAAQYLHVLVRLRRHLRLRHYDVVHSAMARAYVAASLTARYRGGPYIVGWRRNQGIHLDGRPVAAALEILAARRSDVLVANSQAVAQYWIDRTNVPAERIRVVPNALAAWRFERVPHIPDDGTVVQLVTVGSLRGVKGHEVLIEAAAMLGQMSWTAEIVIVGAGPRGAELRARADELGVRVRTPGHVTDTRPWLATATIYVHPSHSEGSSNAIAEAMAYGCAIVATDVGGAREMLGDAGVLIPPGDSQALAQSIDHLLADDELRCRLGEAAQARARRLFDLSRVVDKHLEIYKGT